MIKNIIDKAQTENKKVFIYSHVNPDGDAICSERALIEYLEQFDIQATYIVSKKINRNIYPLANLNTKDTLSIIVDTSTLDHTENTKFLKNKKDDIYVYDHHIKSNDNAIEDKLQLPPKNVFRDSEASSNCEVLLNDFDLKKITPEIANFLLEGIISDTSKLQYIKKDTIKNIVTLIIHGANYEMCYNKIAERHSIQLEKGLGIAFVNTKKIDLCDTFGTILLLDNKQVQMLEKLYGLKNIQRKITRMQNIIGCSFNCIIAENEPGEFVVDMRSVKECKNFDVQKIATKYSGGGHHNAAGCQFSSKNGFDINKVENIITTEINQLAKENLNINTKIEYNINDKELAKIFADTNKLQYNVKIDTLNKIQELINNGAHYSPLIANYKTFEQYMLENEIACLIPNQNTNKKLPIVNIDITPTEYANLKKKYNISKQNIEQYANTLQFTRIKQCNINLTKENLEK